MGTDCVGDWIFGAGDDCCTVSMSGHSRAGGVYGQVVFEFMDVFAQCVLGNCAGRDLSDAAGKIEGYAGDRGGWAGDSDFGDGVAVVFVAVAVCGYALSAVAAAESG